MGEWKQKLKENIISEAASYEYDCFSGEYQVLAAGAEQNTKTFEPSIMKRNVMCDDENAQYSYFLFLLRKGKEFYKFAITSCVTTQQFSLSFRKITKNVKEKDLLLISSIQEWNSEPLYLTTDLAVEFFTSPINTMDGYTELTDNKLCPLFGNPFMGAIIGKSISTSHGSAEWIFRTFGEYVSKDFKERYQSGVEEKIGKPYQEIAEDAYLMFIKSREENEE